MLTRFVFPFIIFFFLGEPCFPQCKEVKVFHEKAMGEIHDLYQLTFLHKTPRTKLDTLVHELMYPNYILDSIYYDWSYHTPSLHSVIDRIRWDSLMNQLGALRSPEVFVLLNLPFLAPPSMMDDLSLFDSFLSNIRYQGSSFILNKYFLNNKVSIQLAFPEFETEVMRACHSIQEKYFKKVTYCIPLEGDALRWYEMSLTDPTPYDNSIQKAIKRCLNHPGQASFSKDSILLEVLKIPGIYDYVWGLSSLDSKWQYDSLGVMICVGEDLWKQRGYVERVYLIQTLLSNGWQQNAVTPFYSLDFIQRNRLRILKEEN